MSYTRFDDQHDGGHLTSLRESLSNAVQAATGEPFPIFQDIADIEWGQQFAERITEALNTALFLIPIITPSFLKSAYCREELQQFLQREADLGRSDLVLPIYYIECPELEDPSRRSNDELAQTLAARQRIDWRELRFEAFDAREVRKTISAMATQIRDALERLPPDISRQQTSPLQAQAVNAPADPPDSSVDVAALEPPEGTMRPDSPFYVERRGDQAVLAEIGLAGRTFTIKGPRQVGKSSLLSRAIAVARHTSKSVVWIDFQQFDEPARQHADTFFRQFCGWISEELDLNGQLDVHWDTDLGNVQRCTRYMQRHVLKELDSPLVLAMDEVDSILDSPFRTDFFGMLRSWHNSRATRPLWRHIDLALVTSTEPYQLVADLNQSPFNVGEVIELTDFTPEQVADLNGRHGMLLTSAEVEQLMDLLNGQPYLVRRALYLVASKRMHAAEIFAQATQDGGPFDKHLQHHLRRLRQRVDLSEELLHIIRNQAGRDILLCERLFNAGLLRREGKTILPRCQLYAEYFRERLT
jgi:hypothetical protein